MRTLILILMFSFGFTVFANEDRANSGTSIGSGTSDDSGIGSGATGNRGTDQSAVHPEDDVSERNSTGLKRRKGEPKDNKRSTATETRTGTPAN